MRSFAICLFLIFCVKGVFAQVVEFPSKFLPQKTPQYKRLLTSRPARLVYNRKPLVLSYPGTSGNLLPVNYYAKNLGIVCKMELKLQKQVGLPIFIRAGSKSYVDRLEGK